MSGPTQELKFDPKFLTPIQNRLKQATTRMGMQFLHLGLAKATFGEKFEWLVVTRVELIRFEELTLTHAMLEGYDRTEDLRIALLQFYPAITPESEVTFIRFERLSPR